MKKVQICFDFHLKKKKKRERKKSPFRTSGCDISRSAMTSARVGGEKSASENIFGYFFFLCYTL